MAILFFVLDEGLIDGDGVALAALIPQGESSEALSFTVGQIYPIRCNAPTILPSQFSWVLDFNKFIYPK